MNIPDRKAIITNFQKLSFYCFMRETTECNCDNYYFLKLSNNEFVKIGIHRYQSLYWGLKPIYVLLKENLDIITGVYLDHSGYSSHVIEFLDINGHQVDIDENENCLLFAKERPERIEIINSFPENIPPVGDLRMFLINGVDENNCYASLT
jgi:hypothetical protein